MINGKQRMLQGVDYLSQKEELRELTKLVRGYNGPVLSG